MTSPDRWSELDSLLDRLVDGIAGDREIRELNRILSGDAEACRRYLQYMGVHSRLVWADGLVKDEALGPATEAASTGLAELAAGRESPEPPAVVSPLRFATRFPSALSTLLFNGVSCCVLAALIICGVAIVGWILTTSHPKEVAIERKPQQPVGGKTESQQSHPARNQAPAAGEVAAASRSRPAESTIGACDAADMIGKGLVLESGARQFAYGTGTKVALQGPFKFAVPSANSGALFYGKSTVSVTTDSPFSLQMPGTLLACSGGEFGVDLDRAGKGWIQVFRGGATLWLPDSGGLDATKKITLGENESVRVRLGDNGCTATVIHDAGLAAALAKRMPPRLPRQGRGKELSPVALAQKRNATVLPGSAAAVAAAAETDTNSMCLLASTQNMPSGAKGPMNPTRTARFTLSELAPHVKLADLVPGRCALRVRFVAHRFVVYAIRLNGKEILLPAEPFGGTVRQLGAVMIREGFVAGDGINVLEFDVRSTEPGQVLPAVLNGPDAPVVVTWDVLVLKASPAAPPNAPRAKDNATEKK